MPHLLDIWLRYGPKKIIMLKASQFLFFFFLIDLFDCIISYFANLGTFASVTANHLNEKCNATNYLCVKKIKP